MSLSTITPFTQYADNIIALRYAHEVSGRKETWDMIAGRVVASVLGAATVHIPRDVYIAVYEMIRDRKFIPGGRILSQAGRPYHQTDNCFCLRAEDSREGWANLAHKCTMMFMSGGGVGVDYSEVRPYGTKLKRSGGIASGPLPLINMVNSIGAAARQGGERRGAIYASLRWCHEDIAEFIKMKQDGVSLQHTNISVRFDREWLEHVGYSPSSPGTLLANSVFMSTLQHACQYGDPGFQFDTDNQILRNACTEIITADDSDSCCIGSVNLAAIADLQELAEVTELATLFLLCNTLYTEFPTDKVRQVKEKNRRIGLGLMGIGEWFIQRQLPYGCTDYFSDFEDWLQVWKEHSNIAASACAAKLNIALPIAVRAIAPTGTISTAIGHTTPGIEPVFHTAYQRTYNTLKSKEHKDGFVREIVIEPVVQKWMEMGYSVRDVETAYTLSQSTAGIERRLQFQAFVQRYVDNAISSTINLPQYEEGIAEKIAPLLLKYLPQLRGVTFYPDGRYENQPVKPIDIVDVQQAVIGNYESCKIEGCGA